MYKDKLGFKNYGEFGRAADISGNWINELSKKEEIKQVNDMNQLIKLCRYLGVTIDELVINDIGSEKEPEKIEMVDYNFISEECNDIGFLINEAIILLDKDYIEMDGIQLSNKAKQTCKDSLMVVKTLTKQHL